MAVGVVLGRAEARGRESPSRAVRAKAYPPAAAPEATKAPHYGKCGAAQGVCDREPELLAPVEHALDRGVGAGDRLGGEVDLRREGLQRVAELLDRI